MRSAGTAHALLVIVFACTFSATHVAAQEWRTVDELRIAPTGVASRTTPGFSGVSGITALGDGFHVLEARSGKLFGFTRSGALKWSVPAEGPSAGKAMTLLGLTNGELVLPDSQTNSFAVYDTSGVFLRRTANTLSDEMTRAWTWIGAQPIGYLVWMYGVRERIRTRPDLDDPGQPLYLMGWPDGANRIIAYAAVTPPVELDPATEHIVLNGQRQQVLLAGAHDRVFIAKSTAYRIDAYDVNGRIINTISRNVKRLPSTARDRISARRDLNVLLDSMTTNTFKPDFVLPDSAQAITAIVAGDSLLLVRRGGFESKDPPVRAGASRWDVHTFGGRYLGWFDLEAKAHPFALHDSRIYSALRTGGATDMVLVTALRPPGT